MSVTRVSLLSLSLSVAFCACAPDGARNVVLVTVDTLRADHLGCYGYSRPTSPRIDAFAAGAVLYERAMASAPWTVPSHASLFTGLDPFEHGAYSFPATPGMLRNVHPLESSHTTLAEALSEEGYATAAFVANAGFLHRSLGLDQGFGTYHPERVPAVKLNERVFEWLESHRDERFFLFVNYMDAHWPYNTRPRPGQIDPPASRDRELYERLFEQVMPGDSPAPRELSSQVIAQYDTGVAHADAAVGALIDRLAALGLDTSTTLVVTSDHGEYFGEHGLVGHSKDVYQAALHVPLVIGRPGVEDGSRVAVPVSSADVPGLIAQTLTAQVSDSLAERFARDPLLPIVSENYFSRARDMLNPPWNARFQRVRRAIFAWPLKYVWSSDGAHELYDLASDSDENRDLIEQRPLDASRLASLLEARLAARPVGSRGLPASELTPAELEELRELGYVD